MSAESVVTIVRSMRFARRPAAIAQAMTGAPASGCTFFPGTPLEPPRAGIKATTSDKLLVSSMGCLDAGSQQHHFVGEADELVDAFRPRGFAERTVRQAERRRRLAQERERRQAPYRRQLVEVQ